MRFFIGKITIIQTIRETPEEYPYSQKLKLEWYQHYQVVIYEISVMELPIVIE